MPLRVLYIPDAAESPSKQIRIFEPLARLHAAGLVEPVPLPRIRDGRGGIDLGAVAGIDAVFLHFVDLNLRSAPLLAPLLDRARDAGVAVVVDTDDPYVIAADCAAGEDYAPHVPAMKELCAKAHLVTVTTPALARELASFLPASVVVPNLVDYDRVPKRLRRSPRVRVGWSGGPTHLRDVASFLPGVARLQRELPIDVVLFGLYDRDIAATAQKVRALSTEQRKQNADLHAFGALADALVGLTFEHHPSVPYDAFAERLAELDLDVGVCPLVDTRFNRCRSAVKFYQYAAAGTVAVASDVAPYRGECNRLVGSTPDDWAEALLPLVCDAALREAVLAEQQAFVRAHRSWGKGLPLYAHLFAGVCELARRDAGRRAAS